MSALTLGQLAEVAVPAAVALEFVPDRELNDRDPFTESAVLLEVKGEGDDLRATFRSSDGRGESYSWEAYIYDGRLSFGSSAEELRVLSATTLWNCFPSAVTL